MMNTFLLTITLFFTPVYIQAVSWLSTKHDQIVDENKHAVRLRGVNLGSWLAEEIWLLPIDTKPPKKSPFTDIKDRTDFWRTLEARFSPDVVKEIRTAFRNTWIQERDFAQIKALGFNVVRLPFLYDLMDETPNLFTYLDKALEYAKKHDLYIILDMHGAPGRQSDAAHTGEQNRNTFFSNEFCQEKAKEIWRQIAKRYKNAMNIAGYDLLNEPKGAKRRKTLRKIYDGLYKAVRKEDSKHLIFIEDGYKGIQSYPDPKKMKWKHVVYSRHIYFFEKNSINHAEVDKVHAAQYETKAPFFIGEFNIKPHGELGQLRALVERFNEKKLSYTFWNYKTGRKPTSLWGLYNAPKKLRRLNPFKDSPKELLHKIATYHTGNFVENKGLVAVFR
jgi:endoglucanase